MTRKKEYVIRNDRVGDMTVFVEVDDNLKGLRWRMSAEGITTQWYSYYEGLCWLETSLGRVIIATAYWESLFPEFVPILLQPAEAVNDEQQTAFCPNCNGTGYDKGTKCSCQED